MKLNEVFVNFVCELCGNTEQVSISEMLQVGNPLCVKCNEQEEEMEAIDVECSPSIKVGGVV